MEKNERLSLFTPGLSLIVDTTVRNFCEILLENADEYFFHEAASSTGKYHPQYALGEGGLARHSIAVAIILNDMLRTDCYQFTDKEKDLLVCAAIVHDIKKYGNGGRYTVKEHPDIASQYVIDTQKLNNIISESDAKFMADAIKTHMGQWGAEPPSTDAQKLVHMADCLSSRKYIEVKFDHPDVVNINESKKNDNPTDPGDYVLEFGKHQGKKIKDVPMSYLDYIVNNFNKEHPAYINSKKYIYSDDSLPF